MVSVSPSDFVLKLSRFFTIRRYNSAGVAYVLENLFWRLTVSRRYRFVSGVPIRYASIDRRPGRIEKPS
jgi:hypothetical protein